MKLNLTEAKLLESNSFSIDYEEILKNLNSNKEISSQNHLGDEFSLLKSYLKEIEDVIFFLNALLQFDIKKDIHNTIKSFLDLTIANSSRQDSPFLLYNKFSFSTSTNNITFSYQPSDTLLVLSFAMWTLWKSKINVVDSISTIGNIFSAR